MSKTSRMLSLATMTLMATATLGVSATAATAAPAQTAAPLAVQHLTDPPGDDNNRWRGGDRWRGRDRSRIAGYFVTRWGCNRAGWIGERRGYWTDFECDRSFRSRYWVLRVERNRGGWPHAGGGW